MVWRGSSAADNTWLAGSLSGWFDVSLARGFDKSGEAIQRSLQAGDLSARHSGFQRACFSHITLLRQPFPFKRKFGCPRRELSLQHLFSVACLVDVLTCPLARFRGRVSIFGLSSIRSTMR